MIELRPEQRPKVEEAKAILKAKGMVYIAGEIRVGKTPMAMITAYESGWRRVGFITKKNAISGIEKFRDNKLFDTLIVTNFEQAHKLVDDCDGYIIDEVHALGAFAKPSKRTKVIRDLVYDKPLIVMSGSPTPEAPSQIFHQFWISKYSPFVEYANFYKWAKDFVDVRQKMINGWMINDYSRGLEDKIKPFTDPYMVRLSQEEAGFTSMVEEHTFRIPIDERMYKLMDILKRDKVYTMKNGDTIVADTPVRLQSVFHQLSSGSINITKIIDGKEIQVKHILDESKAWWIKGKFAGQKIAILYKFIAEGQLLRRVFPNYTEDPYEFNKSEDKVFIRQIVSAREGNDLSSADWLVMYNIDFSATSYWQGRGRMQTKDRGKASKLAWIFSERGIEDKVYAVVSKKKNFTLAYFNKAFGIKQAFRNRLLHGK